jgi:hypothetical protein
MKIKIKPPKLPEPWKMTKTREGHMTMLPTRMRIKPNKYNPKAGPAPKNSPSCLNMGLKSGNIIKCNSCMWQSVCN